MKVVKNKVAPPFHEAEFDLLYGSGIHRAGEVLDLGVQTGRVDKSSSHFSLKGERIGQGRERATEWLREHPDALEALAAELLGTPAAAAPPPPLGAGGGGVGQAARPQPSTPGGSGQDASPARSTGEPSRPSSTSWPSWYCASREKRAGAALLHAAGEHPVPPGRAGPHRAPRPCGR